MPRTPLFLFVLLFQFAQAQLPPESDPHRGLYCDFGLKTRIGNSSIIEPAFSTLSVDTNRDGIFEKEDALLQYACENHITYLALYDMGKIYGGNLMAWNENTLQYENLEKHLCRFIAKAKNEYGVTQIGAIGGSAGSFDEIADFMNRYPVDTIPGNNGLEADIDVLNVEYEFWGDCANDFDNFYDIIENMYQVKEAYNASHPHHQLITEAYLAFLGYCSTPGILNVVQTIDGCRNCSPLPGLPNPQPQIIDRILYTMSNQIPATVGFSEQNLFEHTDTHDTTDFHPIFYATLQRTGGNYDFMGTWLTSAPQNTIFIAEEYYLYNWLNTSNSALGLPRMNDVQAGGIQWFSASHMLELLNKPKLVQTAGPFCTTDSSRIILGYYGPNEPGTHFEFWITNDDDGSNVYPQAGTISGLTHSTIPNPAVAAIDFNDTTIFPPVYLPLGNYTAHLRLAYENGTGCSYACEYPIVVEDKPKLTVVGDTVFCAGRFSYVKATFGGTNYAWYRNGLLYSNGTNNTLRITDSGEYYCTITGLACSNTTDTIRFHANPMPFGDIHSTCPGNGTVTLRADDLPITGNPVPYGRGGVLYEWNDGSTTREVTFNTPSSRRDFIVKITDPYSGCSIVRKHILIPPLNTPFTAQINVIQTPGASCTSDGNLSATLTPVPGIYDPISYLWSNGETTQTIGSLPAGNYTVVISNNKKGCSSYASVQLGNPSSPPAMNEVITDASCSYAADGSISLNPGNGFQYYWPEIPDINGYSSTSRDQQNLYPGFYSLVVTDTSGCQYRYTFEVGMASTPIEVTPSNVVSATGCASNPSGSAGVMISGGSSPYTQAWMDGAGNALPNGNQLHGGSYRVVVTDNAGCTGMTYVSIPSEQLPLTSALADSSSTTVSCDSAGDGRLNVQIEGGVPPYSVNAPWILNGSLARLENLSPGSYIINITDTNGCMLNDTLYIQPSDLQLQLAGTPTNCVGCANGKIDVMPQGGNPPYAITWSPSTGMLNGNSIEQLTADTYEVCITDTNLCQVCSTVVVLDDPLFVPEPPASAIELFPNPTSGTFELLSLPMETSRLLIIDVSGRVQETYFLKDKRDLEFDARSFSNGMYAIVLLNESASVISVLRMVVQH